MFAPFVVKDHLRDQFSTWAAIGELGAFRVAIQRAVLHRSGQNGAPALRLALLDTISQIEAELKRSSFEAVAIPDESGFGADLTLP